MIHEGDLSPDAFGDEVDEICNEIHEACAGFGTDESRLLKAVGGLTPDTRCKVPIRYKALFDKELKKVIKSECGSRDFGKALQYLAVTPDEAECDMIEEACKGGGTNTRLLSTIIVGRTNVEMEILKKNFFAATDNDLGRLLDKELGGHYEQLIFNCLQAAEEAYDEDYHTEELCKEDVIAFYKMGQGKWGTDEKGLFKLICARPAEHLVNVNRAYADEYGFTLFKAMEKELGGDAGKAALFALGMKLKSSETVAGLIHDACKGFGTNELLLTTALIRYQGILTKVKEAYAEEYGKSLEDTIRGETGGDFRQVLLEVVATADTL
eukprot:CAMPEP_0198137210 /NCGR_PEP_ID=MMETSP1443-20131203/739_1 /TAXON_ID=186043 /ORGANISM="Entomoneis sp., Strain CCMP2396" /LENGTH=323 /DNA_ID=CAMNT_0043798569 /DNA_START=41 /DNA_END=1012 /DNA_ORIENTATION=+